MYPSEYAYKNGSVTEQESVRANCRRYPSIDGLPQGIYSNSTNYIHCDGELKLADKILGSEQSFNSSSHYQWPARSAEPLLFIFPTRVSLTTITLHYYSDSDRGLPRLNFYAVPDEFAAWNTPTINHSDAVITPVLPVRGRAGRRSVSVNTVNFNTKKVLMYKFNNNFMFAVSEVEFFTCRKYTILIDCI